MSICQVCNLLYKPVDKHHTANKIAAAVTNDHIWHSAGNDGTELLKPKIPVYPKILLWLGHTAGYLTRLCCLKVAYRTI